MLSSVFLVGGIQTARNPGGAAKMAEPIALPIAEKIPGLPTDTEMLVRINAIAQVGAAAMLATGRLRRLSSAVLFGSLALTTAAGHPFWEEDDEKARRGQLIHFLKNLSVAGGLLLSMVDTDGKPSLGWRARRRAERTSASLKAGTAGAAAALARTTDALPLG